MEENQKLINNSIVYSLNKIHEMLALIGMKMNGQGNPYEVNYNFAVCSERLGRHIEDIEINMKKENMMTPDFSVKKIDADEDAMDDEHTPEF